MQHYTHAQFPGLVGQEIALTDWLEITQDRIDRFADATDDHQWIHVDAERARGGPFGATNSAPPDGRARRRRGRRAARTSCGSCRSRRRPARQ
jgi:hypothetical protein